MGAPRTISSETLPSAPVLETPEDWEHHISLIPLATLRRSVKTCRYCQSTDLYYSRRGNGTFRLHDERGITHVCEPYRAQHRGRDQSQAPL